MVLLGGKELWSGLPFRGLDWIAWWVVRARCRVDAEPQDRESCC